MAEGPTSSDGRASSDVGATDGDGIGARGLATLARTDPTAARDRLATLPPDAQVEIFCETPVSERGRLLDLVAEPEKLIPLLPEAEICFTLRAGDVRESAWILAHSTPEQLVACVDLDAWCGEQFDRERFDDWITAAVEADEDTALRLAESIDIELFVLELKSRIEVVQKTPDDDWEPPEGARTVEGQYFYRALREGDDLASITLLLHILFRRDHPLYVRILMAVNAELPIESQEWALRWRNGRLEDLGFVPRIEAVEIYAPLPEARMFEVPDEPLRPGEVGWRLPVWIPRLPVSDESELLLFRAAAQLDRDQRGAFFYALVALANRVAVADRLVLGDVESIPKAIGKAAEIASLGLEALAHRRGESAERLLVRVPLRRLFRLGVTLDPDRVPPRADEVD